MGPLETVQRRIATTLSALTCAAAFACTATEPPPEAGKSAERKTEAKVATKTVETKTVETKTPETKTPAATTTSEETEAQTTGRTGTGRTSRRLPRCPSGEWCGSPVNANKFAVNKNEGGRTRLRCPTKLKGTSSAKQALELRKQPSFRGLPTDSRMRAKLDVEATKKTRKAGEKNACCYKWTEMCPGGRPLLVEHEPVTATLRGGDVWSEDIELEALDDSHLRHSLAREWLDDALAEHASVASFARFTLELMALGAPPELVAAAQQAGLDEVGHARACFSAAAALGLRRSPGPLPQAAPREASFAQLAHDTFIEGCVGETIAAVLAERMARVSELAQMRSLWGRIAREEAEHAALAWAVLEWALTNGGEPAWASVRRAIEAVRPHSADPRPEADARKLALGRPDAKEKWQARRDTWTQLIEPQLRRQALGSESPALEHG